MSGRVSAREEKREEGESDKMGREIKRIDIPKTDVWSALFDRKEGDRTFPDEQGMDF